MPRTIPVLLYHAVDDDPPPDERPWAVDPATLQRHIRLLQDAGAVGLSVGALADHLAGGEPVPERSVVITFDDGRAEQLPSAAAFAAAGYPATVYVTSGYVGRPGYLSTAGVAELATVPDVVVGAHSVNHRHLDITPRDGMADEIERSRRTLAEWCGHDVVDFAYPHGSHTGREREHLQAHGWRSGAAVKNAISHSDDDRFGFARVTVTAAMSDDTLRSLLDGQGAPLAWRRERIRTRAGRQLRRAQQRRAAMSAGKGR